MKSVGLDLEKNLGLGREKKVLVLVLNKVLFTSLLRVQFCCK